MLLLLNKCPSHLLGGGNGKRENCPQHAKLFYEDSCACPSVGSIFVCLDGTCNAVRLSSLLICSGYFTVSVEIFPLKPLIPEPRDYMKIQMSFQRTKEGSIAVEG